MNACQRRVILTALVLVASGSTGAAQTAKKKGASKPPANASKGAVLVIVNEQKITESDLNRLLTTRQVAEEARDKFRRRFIEDLIDLRLIQQFLASRKTSATKEEIDAEINRLKAQIKQSGRDPDQVMAETGYTAEALRQEFAVPMAWKRHVDRAVPASRLKKYFDEHREEFDGTKVRASRILIKPASGEEEAWKSAEAKLSALRRRIVERQIAFEDAAGEFSAAPSKEQGGDVGWFQFTGKMPERFSREAFRLAEGEISEPFRTHYGVELCEATGRKPGDLSLEDVREDVLARLSQEMWKETVAKLRETAKIEWKIEKP
ncbi:MAG TPA: peptidylprolyl isomerase [Planctomycetaceae bacterium]|nr:peptidylprolyl isomerase [Planctomycetaceae bacterium]